MTKAEAEKITNTLYPVGCKWYCAPGSMQKLRPSEAGAFGVWEFKRTVEIYPNYDFRNAYREYTKRKAKEEGTPIPEYPDDPPYTPILHEEWERVA